MKASVLAAFYQSLSLHGVEATVGGREPAFQEGRKPALGREFGAHAWGSTLAGRGAT